MTDHKNIATALAAAQLEMGKAFKQSSNPHFRSKYADLGNVMDACMEALNKHGIAVVQPVTETELGRYVETRFIHETGETLICPIPLILGKQDMQGLGSAMTYARRYGLMALAGIAPEDDDGNAAAANAPKELSWSETIIAELPEGSTEAEKATALMEAIMAQWKHKRTAGELVNEWKRREKLINGLRDRFPSQYGNIIESYEARMQAVAPADVAAE